MSHVVTLTAEPRSIGTKGELRALREEGFVPGVIYGGDKEPYCVSLPRIELWKHISTGRFSSTLTELSVGEVIFHVIAKDIQFDPVRDTVVHVDFLRVDTSKPILVKVPVHVSNQELSPGLKRGGTVNLVVHELELLCLPNTIPDEIVLDLTGLNIGDSIHIHQVALPEGVTPASRDLELTLVSIAGMMEDKGDEQAEGKEEGALASSDDGAKKK